MKVLVTSSTGTVGSRVVEKLRTQSDVEVYQATRKPSMAGQVHFDLSSEPSLEKALVGMDKLVLITPASTSETEDSLRVVRCAQKVGVRHIVFMSIHQVDRAPHIPHFASKIEIQKELVRSGLPWTTIAPNNFYQNDYWFKESLLDHGIYPQPYGHVGLSRVDADDIATALANAVKREDLVGQIFPLVGPEALTVQDVCDTYARHLKKDILYGGDDLKRWFDFNKQFLPEWLLMDWLQMYEFFQAQGLRASALDYIQQEKILGHPPKQFETFVKETVQLWKK
nr:NmrA/HSCARG family protein [Bdellovibrio sp. HM001]